MSWMSSQSWKQECSGSLWYDELIKMGQLINNMVGRIVSCIFLIKQSSSFVVRSVREIKLCKLGRELPCAADQEERPSQFLAVEIRWFLRK